MSPLLHDVRRATPPVRALVARIGPDPRRMWRRVDPAFVRRLRLRLLEALDHARLCEHITHPNQARFWLVERPDTVLCQLCSMTHHATRDQPGQPPNRCDECGSTQPTVAVAVVFEVIAVHVNFCCSCAAEAGIS